jgi:ribulose-phosphate 3-epimerase
MAEIIPAVLGEDFTQVKEKLEKVKGLTEWVSLDVVDGRFAEPLSWGAGIDHHLHLWEPTELPRIEIHLMLENPKAWLADWISTSVERILIHVEIEGDKHSLLKQIKAAGVQAGIVLKHETSIDVVDEYINEVDVVQLMSIATIGAHGAPFEEGIYEKIKALRTKHPNAVIQIDGGVNLENAKKLIDAGANNLAIGSALWNSGDVGGIIQKFKNL